MINIIGDEISHYRKKSYKNNEFFYDYLKKERAFSSHTIDAYRNDLDRFILSFPKTLSDLNQIDKDMIYNFIGYFTWHNNSHFNIYLLKFRPTLICG